MTTFAVVQGDTLPLLAATLAVNGVATNLTGATVALKWSIGGLTGSVAGTLVTPASGTCSFSLATLPAGSGRGEIEVTFADASVRTYPSAEPFTLVVRAGL